MIFDAHSNCWGSDGLVKAATKDLVWLGACKDGMFDGAGALITRSDGVVDFVTSANFSRGLAEGPGTQTSGQSIFIGTFHDGVREGPGTFIYTDGERMDANLHNNKLEGKFVVTHQNGGRHEGVYHADLENGLSVELFPDGHHIEGMVRDGKTVGVVTYVSTDGRRLENYESQKPDPGFPHQVIYPSDAIADNQEGIAWVTMTITDAGAVINPRIVGSSGSKTLDDAAIATVLGWRYIPAHAAGKAITITDTLVNINFQLTNR